MGFLYFIEMAKDKRSFVLYVDSKETLEALSDENAGKLIKHIFRYVNDENPKTPNELINIAFLPIKNQLKRDLKRWESKQEQRRLAGLKSAESRRTKSNESEQPLTTVESRSTKLTVNVSGSGSVSGSVKDIFNVFWDLYHSTTGKQKSDKEPSLKHWKKLTQSEMELAINKIEDYVKNQSEIKYCKKARTYLADKNFNDEYHSSVNPKRLTSGKNQSYEDLMVEGWVDER